MSYDALMVVSFGGPEGLDEVIPFLENVLRGRNVPRERMLEVAEHYQHFGGVSPLNAQNRALIEALRPKLSMPIYFGNRNWHPLLPDAVRQMAADGVRRALCFVTSAWGSYSGCRQYRDNLAEASAFAGAPELVKLRQFYNHPLFLEAVAARLRAALAGLEDPLVMFTAHSVPTAAAGEYPAQVHEASSLAAGLAGARRWTQVWQSRSGPPAQPWLEPDVLDALRCCGEREVVLCPIGFLSDHMEVMYDLDTEAWSLCQELGIRMVRAATVGTDPLFVEMIRELVAERVSGAPRRFLGSRGAPADECPPDCCVYRR